MGLLREADEYIQVAWQIDPSYGNAHALVGDFLSNRSEIDPIIPFTAFQRAQQFSPDYINYGNSLGYYYAEQHQLDKAEQAFLEASRIGPRYDISFLNLATYYLNGEQVDKAVVALEKALMYNPKNAQACYNLVQLYLDAGKRKQALTLLERTLSLLPDDPLLAEAYAQLTQPAAK